MFDFDVRSGQDQPYTDRPTAQPWQPVQQACFFEPLSSLPRRSAVMVAPGLSLAKAFTLMAERRATAALVASHGVLLGMLSEHEMARRLLEDEASAGQLPVWKAMAPAAETLLESDTVAYAVHKLCARGGRAMAIVEPSGAPLGVLEIQDVVAWMCGRVGAGPRLQYEPG